MNIKCKACENEIEQSSKFCPNCGAKVEDEADEFSLLIKQLISQYNKSTVKI